MTNDATVPTSPVQGCRPSTLTPMFVITNVRGR
jgi:hypothetical protein